MTEALIKCKKLSLSSLGREIDLPIQERSAIRRSDRFLGNLKLHAEREQIFKIHASHVIGSYKRPDIIVDWSNIPNTTHNTIRAALVVNGRAITLYEEVHPESKQNNTDINNQFLCNLRRVLPENCRPIIITDGGFHNDWFKQVLSLGWDYIGRIRAGSGKKFKLEDKEDWKSCSILMQKATKKPHYIGKVLLCKHNPINTFLYAYKEKRKKRRPLDKLFQKRKGGPNADPRRTTLEPWLLASSLHKGYNIPKKVTETYRNRMQIEEGFRDLKSSRYGFGFENACSKKIERIEILLLIAMLAAYIAWLVGRLAEKRGLHMHFQTNSIKNRRVISLCNLGCRLIKKKTTINMLEAMREGAYYG
jgi:hypothetical protein